MTRRAWSPGRSRLPVRKASDRRDEIPPAARGFFGGRGPIRIAGECIDGRWYDVDEDGQRTATIAELRRLGLQGVSAVTLRQGSRSADFNLAELL